MSSRAEGLARLELFLERVPLYDKTRNYDRPGHEGVSRLSPWIRYRVVTEEECVTRVLERHPFPVAEKFIQEILWRTYWKGWLEMRPAVWERYVTDVTRLKDLHQNKSDYRAACEGRTDLPFFNEWVKELADTGYLHNHTRMWFASVWIFTLQLPWQLGAAFMYHHLLDGDPASNTLSWRWVGGLHTKGKIYVARPDNIATYSAGRWTPKEDELARDPQPLPFDGEVEPAPLAPIASAPLPHGSLVLVHDDDLSADLAAQLSSTELHYAVLELPRTEQSERVRSHVTTLRGDAANRAGAHLVSSAESIATLARNLGVATVHSFIPPLGFEHQALMDLALGLKELGISISWHRRAWDTRYMPLARGGFFRFWEGARREMR
jgi:deoxyribodipyrimidine photo-lyase